ncbi:DNA polymerase III subunit gamma/tau [Porphyromonas somerae]|uniref:DNA polymerase III subunit gamma/tau n=1 Tax=Porphyromonas somerae TaxID=322095 RepID=A0A134BCM3_9PORP|nr:DNA polymerase III subunit gamma/tau [Porphyromonas somerae]KXB76452.1 DNA polymerase III, subunit gamma and tau [Porphyromonadaceae bacterium KA00676]KXB77704.1 DNA polymerase III, subunit gamma and tau [Porphyromonas somerae]
MTEHYVVSARKYRPDTFRSIVGQEAMASTLRTAVRSGKLSHAYLFCGPRGVGKTTAARVLARTINCENLSAEGEACGQCESCKAFEEQRSFNIFELDAASNNSVEDIRQLTEQVQMPPALGRYKVYIIDEVHMLSAAAFNAFLKTLEEPPSYAIFILATTEKHKILPTILSRCQIYDFKRITVQDITRHLRYVADSEGIDAEETALGLIAEKADGGMRDALSMFDRIASFAGGHITYQHALESLNVLDYTYFIRIFELFLSGDHRSVLLLLDELMGKGFEGQTILTGLSAFVRDLLVAQHPETLQLLEKPDAVAASYATIAQQCTPASLFAALKTLVQADQQYRGATNKRLLVELSFLSMVPLFKRDSDLNLPAAPAPATPQTATPQAAPQTPPATTPPASPAPKAQTAPVVAPAPAPAPAPAASATPPPPAPPSSAPKRLFGARRRADAPSEASSTAPAEAPTPVEDKDFTEDDLQRAWVRFVEQELTPSQILYRNILRPELPKLLDGVQAEISLPPGEAIHTTVMEVYPQLVEFLRTTLQNRKFNLILREKTVEEQAKIVLTQEDRFNQLAEINPEVRKLKEALGLRFS